MTKLTLLRLSAFAASAMICVPVQAFASPRDAFGLDAESSARAMAVTASASPLSAAATNPARLLDARAVEASFGLTVAEDQFEISRRDAGLDTYVGYQFGIAFNLPLGKYRDRLFAGANIHLPHRGLYEVNNTAAATPVVLGYGSDARRFSLDAAVAVRIWERIAFGVGLHLMPNVSANVNIDLSDNASRSYSNVKVDYSGSPVVGLYAEPIAGLHLGFSYHAASRLGLKVPAEVSVSDAIGRLHVQLSGFAYAEPHEFSLGVRYDFSRHVGCSLARFAADLEFQYKYYPDSIATSASVTLFDDEGNEIDSTKTPYDDYNHAWALRASLTWLPADFASVSIGYAFKKSPVPAQRNIFNVLDSDSSTISFGTTLWLPEEYLGAFGIGFSTAGIFNIHVTRDMEKYEFMHGNPGFPSIRFEGFNFTWHGAILMRFE